MLSSVVNFELHMSCFNLLGQQLLCSSFEDNKLGKHNQLWYVQLGQQRQVKGICSKLPSFVILVNYCFNKYARYCNLETNEAKNCFQSQNSMSSTLVEKKHAWTHLWVVASCLVDESRCTQTGMNTTLKPIFREFERRTI